MRGTGNSRQGRSAAIAVAAAVAFCLAPAAQADAAWVVGKVKLAGNGSQSRLLVPMNLPLEVSGSRVTGRITINLPNQQWSRTWQARAHAGPLRPADRREFFHYVHGVRISAGLAKAIARNGARSGANSRISYSLPDADPTVDRGVAHAVSQRRVRRARPGLCETLPRVLLESAGAQARMVSYPVCGRPLKWKVRRPPSKGGYVAYPRKLKYSKSPGQTGADEFEVAGYFKGRLVATQRIHVRIGNVAASKVSVIAFGDSVTAGFGYFGKTGKQMTIEQLIDCRPGATVFNDACSSNSYNRNSSIGDKPDYLPDFGLSRNISWTAQWANEYGITDYANYAVTGSAPSDWLPEGQFHSTLERIQGQNPGYILLTMGANPLLSDVLFGIDNMGCALESDLFGDFTECVMDAFYEANLLRNLNQLYNSLVTSTSSKIVVMQYHLSIPSIALAYSSAQIEMMGRLLNEVIADQAAQVSPERITVVAPPRFDVGIDMEPLYPSDYSCSFFGYKVDGPSVQATVTQDELLLDHPLSFCSGPAVGPPWVISGDTGIHPSAAGYFQMASRVPAPGS